MPEVSVVIPTYNAARFVDQAIGSVLAQTFQDFEILVVDGGSTDGTEGAVRRHGPPVRFLPRANRGMADARNYGIENSRGRYVAFLDADDTWFPGKLERQLAEFASHPGRRMCYTAHLVVDRDLAPIRVERCTPVRHTLGDLLLRGNIVKSVSTVLCERSLLDEIGAFDPDLKYSADWDVYVRMACRTEFLYIDEPLATYRIHDANFSRNVVLHEHDNRRVLEKGFALPGLPASLLARRRAAFARNHMVLAGCYFHAQRYRDFARCALTAIASDYRQAGYLLSFPVRAASRLLPVSPSTAGDRGRPATEP